MKTKTHLLDVALQLIDCLFHELPFKRAKSAEWNGDALNTVNLYVPFVRQSDPSEGVK